MGGDLGCPGYGCFPRHSCHSVGELQALKAATSRERWATTCLAGTSSDNRTTTRRGATVLWEMARGRWWIWDWARAPDGSWLSYIAPICLNLRDDPLPDPDFPSRFGFSGSRIRSGMEGHTVGAGPAGFGLGRPARL
ncbi:MAG: hypothetical protein NVS3B27_14550 [Novosphingobium sp.]